MHTLLPLPKKEVVPQTSDSIVESFAKSLVSDVYVNACLQARYLDRLVDLAYANALAFSKIKPVERILTTATKMMTAMLMKINTGTVKGSMPSEQEQTVNELGAKMMRLKETFKASLTGEQIELEEVFDENVKNVTETLEPFGPFLEAPSLRHTERIGPCSIYNETLEPAEWEIEQVFRKSLETLAGIVPSEGPIDSCWRREQEVEALQAFDSEQHKKAQQEKILSRISQYASGTRLKSIGFPDEDYTQYLRARTFLQGGSRRLLDSLRVAQDALDEDPGKEMGQLDLTSVIQALASKKPATDVFLKDEYLSKSFAWSIILDASASMKIKGEKARAFAICVAEASKELLMDPGSWTMFAFNDRFWIIKDNSEAYTKKVRARIGGLKFEGLTYMPDAMQLAGQILTKRYDEQRCLVVISDGWPYGYADMPTALKESIETLIKKDVILIGVGVETDRMGNFFKLHASVYTQNDLIKKFAKIFVDASAAALEG
jgi:Mg-chelatase subunit ChlD